ncbi:MULTISPECIES: hypothetical protein [unclassified Frigoribacterium]|uniref:hypothetical protein n=1 Tax=unclassified Frigoribacterium TaxID=2627005 RepID=UPI0006F31D77|nr:MULTISPECIES: hypothetical protein [unclassified Frigoribacterium]KQO47959.1 hypothetical protein ASF07_11210 [Frigoribacterium sp. Leaf254]KQT40053.1 hypothetical protein ASG28_11220 [Frigoribacterium sp. Leaf415]
MATTIVMTGETLDGLRREVRATHGASARIVAAQKVTVGGVAGFFARKHYEVTVEVPDPAVDLPVARVRITTPVPAERAGIAALLASADEAEDALQAGAPAPRAAWSASIAPGGAVASSTPVRDGFDDVLTGSAVPVSPRRAARAAAAAAGAGGASVSASAAASASASPSGAGGAVPVAPPADVSTRTDAFASIMDDLTFNGIAPSAGAGVGAGVGTVGAGPTAFADGDAADPDAPHGAAPRRTAASLAAAADALAAQARAVASPGVPPAPDVSRGAGDLVVVVGRPGDAFRVAAQMASTFGLRSVDVSDRRSGILARATGVHENSAVVTALAWDAAAPATLEAIAADQVWVAVDVGRKHDDTARWVEAVRAVAPVVAAAVVGEDDTATPGTVHLLGVPVGWREGGAGR